MRLITRAVRVHGVDGRFYVGVLRDLCCFDVYRAPRVFCGCSVCAAVHRAAAPAHQYAFRAIRAGSFRGGDVSRGRISPASRRNLLAAPRVSRDFGRWFCGGGGLEDGAGEAPGAAAPEGPELFQTRRFCEPQRETLEFEGVGALMRRHRQDGGQLLRERPYACAGGGATHFLQILGGALLLRAVSRARCNETRPKVQGGESALQEAYAPARSYRGIIFGPEGTDSPAMRTATRGPLIFSSALSSQLYYSAFAGPTTNAGLLAAGASISYASFIRFAAA